MTTPSERVPERSLSSLVLSNETRRSPFRTPGQTEPNPDLTAGPIHSENPLRSSGCAN